MCYFRVFKRLFDKNPEIDDRSEGCPEAVKIDLLRYMWSMPKRLASYLGFLQEMYPHVRFIEIKSSEDLKIVEQEMLMSQA